MNILITSTSRLYTYEISKELLTLGHTVVRKTCDSFDDVETAIQSHRPELLVDDWKRHSLTGVHPRRSYLSGNQTARCILEIRKKHFQLPLVILTNARGCCAHQNKLQFVPVKYDGLQADDWPSIISDARSLVLH